MRLKCRDDVEWQDLPKIEDPFFARHIVERAVNVNGFGPTWVFGLEHVLKDPREPVGRGWDAHSQARLLDRIERAEVVLVHGLGSEPHRPAVRRGTGSQGSPVWKADDALRPAALHNVECMISRTPQGTLSTMPRVQLAPIPPPAVRKKQPPAKEKVAVRMGVFFDGTGNNIFNDLSKGTDTNVARLYELYHTIPRKEHLDPIGKQDGLELFTHKFYENGVGTKDGGKDSGWGLGTGADGVKRIDSALDKVRKFLAKFKDKDGPRTVDVFGFSRGASLARDFVNQVNAEFGSKGVEVGFVGIYDTVASFGLGGNNENSRSDQPLLSGAAKLLARAHPVGLAIGLVLDDQFKLNLGPDSAKRIAHLTAMDEVRANFPLHSLKAAEGASPPGNMEEVAVVGVHADVGGGYGTAPFEEIDRIEKRHIYYLMLGQNWQASMMEKKRKLEEEAASRGLVLLYEGSEEDNIGGVTDTYWLARKHTVKPGLSNVYLHWMYDKAQAAEVPLLKLAKFASEQPHRFAIPTELESLFQSNHATAINAAKIREEYVHKSNRDWEDGDEEGRWIVNRAEFDGERTIYYNQPGKAAAKPAASETEDLGQISSITAP